MSEELILAATHITQYTNENNKSDWEVRSNKNNNLLQLFPKHFTDKEIRDIMEFSRKHEAIAFNSGVEKGKKIKEIEYQNKLKQIEEHIIMLNNENERLAEALENIHNKDK